MIRIISALAAAGLMAWPVIAQDNGDTEPPVQILFGDDTSEWANDGECDDPRFIGDGMTATPLMTEDAFHDATDCEAAFNSGAVRLRTDNDPAANGDDPDLISSPDTIGYGDDSSLFANDGECDDPRFIGEGMSRPPHLDADIRADATDCQAAMDAGTIRPKTTADLKSLPEGFALGDNSSRWARDNECDDPRFEGWGAAEKMLQNDLGRDADDCGEAFENGYVTLVEGAETIELPQIHAIETIPFGTNDSQWAGDGECDDPRFEGSGASVKLDPADERRDALDCRAAYENGRIRYIGE